MPISTTTTLLLLFFFPDDEFEAASAFFLDATEDANKSVGFATGLLENADTKALLFLSPTRKSEKKTTKNHATEKTVLLNVLIVVISLSRGGMNLM